MKFYDATDGWCDRQGIRPQRFLETSEVWRVRNGWRELDLGGFAKFRDDSDGAL